MYPASSNFMDGDEVFCTRTNMGYTVKLLCVNGKYNVLAGECGCFTQEGKYIADHPLPTLFHIGAVTISEDGIHIDFNYTPTREGCND